MHEIVGLVTRIASLEERSSTFQQQGVESHTRAGADMILPLGEHKEGIDVNPPDFPTIDHHFRDHDLHLDIPFYL